MKTIQIIVSPKGETRVETKGFAGAECQEASKFIEQALGSKQNVAMKGEYHQARSARQQIRESC